MKSYVREDQYRVVGTMVATSSSRVTWHDTADEAIGVAFSYDKAIVLRPDGSLLGEYYGRRDKGPRPLTAPMAEEEVLP